MEDRDNGSCQFVDNLLLKVKGLSSTSYNNVHFHLLVKCVNALLWEIVVNLLVDL